MGGRGNGGSGGRAWEIAPEPPKGDKMEKDGGSGGSGGSGGRAWEIAPEPPKGDKLQVGGASNW